MYLDFSCHRDAPLSLRYATYYQTENGTDYRKLTKAYGILFQMDVIGEVWLMLLHHHDVSLIAPQPLPVLTMCPSLP